jgi:tRNA G18 (ribose-2'-O)-methylase SpoU
MGNASRVKTSMGIVELRPSIVITNSDGTTQRFTEEAFERLGVSMEQLEFSEFAPIKENNYLGENK